MCHIPGIPPLPSLVVGPPFFLALEFSLGDPMGLWVPLPRLIGPCIRDEMRPPGLSCGWKAGLL